jgi:hypothetical protein
MNKKQLLIAIPLLVAIIGLMYYGLTSQPQTASVANIPAIDYSLPEDSGTIIYETVPTDGAPLTFDSTQ